MSAQTTVAHGSVEAAAPEASSIPSLESGDRLTRYEFERRYAALPHVKKAELIEGMVIVPSPTRHQQHGRPHGAVVTWLGAYSAATPGSELSNNASLRLDLDNEIQPDALLRLVEAVGGNAALSGDDYLEGAPELVAEIAASSVSYDAHAKFQVYRRSGVREYLLWRVDDRALDWYALEQDTYVPLPADAEGTIRSQVFPGLWLSAPALLNGEMARVLATLQQGLESAEHAAFVAELAGRMRATGAA